MASVSGGGKLGAYLRKLAGRIDKADTLEVGFFENAEYDDGTKVAEVAALNEYGHMVRGGSYYVLPRPFFRNMIADHKKDWGGYLRNLMKYHHGDSQAALDAMGEELIGELQDSIIELEAPPLAASTIAKKSKGGVGELHGQMGPEKPLVDSGFMLDSVGKEVS